MYPLSKGGGAKLRRSFIDYAYEQNYAIKVYLIGDTQSKEYGAIQIYIIDKPRLYNYRLSRLLERIGLYEDYLDLWIEPTVDKVMQEIKSDDQVIVTSGGELATIKIGHFIKNKTNVKTILHMRDPINYMLIDGVYKRDNIPHIGRDCLVSKYINNYDLIITHTHGMKKNLISRGNVPIKVVKTGYAKKIQCRRSIDLEKPRLLYLGTNSRAQKAEIIHNKLNNNAELHYIGSKTNKNINNRIYRKYLKIEEIERYVDTKKINIAYVSLSNKYYKVCVPSKIYEYVNLELPILGILPEGDASQYINDNNIGISVQPNEISNINYLINKILSNYSYYTSNIRTLKESCSIENHNSELLTLL